MAEAPTEYDHAALHRMERGGCGDVAFYIKGMHLKSDPAESERASAKDGSPIAGQSPIVCTSCGEAVPWGSLSLEVKRRN